MTQLMTRIFSAQSEGEDAILDQISADIEDTKNTGSLESTEYDMVKTPLGVIIKDKINNEETLVEEPNDKEYHLVEAPKDKSFTRINNSLAVVDQNNGLKGIFNKGDAQAFVKENPKFRLMKVGDFMSIKNK